MTRLPRLFTLLLVASAFLAVPPVRAAEVLTASLTPLGLSRAPIGWVEFCERTPGECRVSVLEPAVLALTDASRSLLERVNARVNHRVRPVSDLDHHGVVERWSYPDDDKGDCEDYVLEKRRQLMRAGVPRQALLITVVRDLKGDGHSVLTVVTDKGDLVLDNQEPDVMLWSETGYRYVKRQAAEHPDRWVSLGGVETAQSVATLLRRR